MNIRHYLSLSGAAGLLLACFTMPVAQAATLVPATLPGAKVVTAQQAKALIDAGVPVVDARVPMEYAEEHIKGAINVPYQEHSAHSVKFDARQDKFDLSRLPQNKAKPLVIYCNGPECWKSYKASVAAVHHGYKQVMWLRGGIPAWKQAGFPTE